MATIFPEFNQEQFSRLWQRRPTPGLRLGAANADVESAESLIARADELIVRQADDAEESKRAQERLQEREKDLPLPAAGDWITNEFYVGEIELWPTVRDTIVEIIESQANIIILRGGTFSAKSFIAEQLIKRSIAEIGCIASPHSYLGKLSRTSPLWVQLMHRKYEDAKDEQLHKLRSGIIDAPWFRMNFPPEARAYNLGVGATYMKFGFRGGGELTVKPVPTNHQAMVGRNLMAFWASECNEYDIVDGSSRAMDGGVFDAGLAIFKEAITRSKRFHRPLKPCVRYIFDSTERYDGDLLARLSQDIESHGLKSIVIQRSQWEVKPGALKGPYFLFAKPAKGKRGEVVETQERREHLEAERREVVEVPVGDEEEYLTVAKAYPDNFARDLGGWPVDAIGRFVDNPEHISRCVDERARYLDGLGIEHDPATALQDEFLPGSSVVDWERLCIFNPETGTWAPRVMPHASRAIHFDLASGGKTGTDYIGMSMGCQVEKHGELPMVWYDFALRLLRDGVRYDFELVRAFVEDLRRHGFRINLVTFDSFQSVDFQEILRGRGYQVDQISMVKNMDGYIAFSAGYHAGLALLPAWDDSVILEELVQLEKKVVNNKEVVEHRPKKHDDVAQAVAAVYWQLKVRSGLGIGMPTVGKGEHPIELERRILGSRNRLWDQLDHVPQAAKDRHARKAQRELRKIQYERSKELRQRIHQMRQQGIDV